MKFTIPKIKIVVERQNPLTVNVVPSKFSLFLTDMNPIVAITEKNVFRGRKKEIDKIFNSLMTTQNANCILIGPSGVGKTITVQMAIERVLQNKCPIELAYHHFLYLDIDCMIAILESGDENEKKKIGEIFTYLASSEGIVVVVDQVHLVATSHLMSYYFSLLLKSQYVKVIGMTRDEEFEDFFYYQNKIKSCLSIVRITEPASEKIYPMISRYIKFLGQCHGVTIKKEMIGYTISIANGLSAEKANPGLAVEYIEKSMIVAKRRKHEEVTKQDINYNFNFDYYSYNKMPQEDKIITAYHEAGHYIVAKKSLNIKNFKPTAISIIPSETRDFLGVTLFEFEDYKQTSMDSEYFTDSIAIDLAGRAAEEILAERGTEYKYTSGAQSDLKNATAYARAVIMEYGMIESCGKNKTYYCNYDFSDLALLSENTKTKIEEETQKLIDEAYERAKRILMDNRELLDLISAELLKHEILDEKELDILCESIDNKV